LSARGPTLSNARGAGHAPAKEPALRTPSTTILTVCAVITAAPPARPAGARTLHLGPVYAAAVDRAVKGAERRLESAECRRIFDDFRDAAGVTLQARLDALGLPARSYLRRIIFTDGFGHRYCHRGHTLALTAPGSRVVYVCGPRFQRAQARDPDAAELVVLHEALHTLGLGENPPESLEITRRVGARCAPAPPGS
jgi:hypothetical protein